MITLSKQWFALPISFLLSLGLSQALADDTEIFTGSSLGGDPVIMLMLDSSGSMYRSMYGLDVDPGNTGIDEYGIAPTRRATGCGFFGSRCTTLRRHDRIFHTQDATQALLGSIAPSVKLGISTYSISDGKLMNQAFALGAIISNSSPNTTTIAINRSEDDGWQSDPNDDNTLATSGTTLPIVINNIGIPGSGTDNIADNWVSSGGINSDHSGNVTIYYYHTSNNSNQTFDLSSAVDTYLFLLDANGNAIAANDDGGPGLNSRINFNGLAQNTLYRLVAATFSSGQAGAFTLEIAESSRGYLASNLLPVEGLAGLHFKNINIPADTALTSAVIEFTASADDSDPVTWNVWLDNSPTPSNLSPNGLTFGSRSWHASITDTPATWITGNTYQVDVTSMLQAHIGTSNSWSGSGEALFRFARASGSGTRRAYSFDNDPANAPRLIITTATAPTTKTVISNIRNRNEDAEQVVGANSVETYQATLPIADDGHLVGLRFTNVELPNANLETVTITDAYIEFYAANNSSNYGEIKIEAEDTPLSTAYKSAANELGDRNQGNATGASVPTGRPVVANSVNWTPAVWNDGEVYRTPNLKDLIQPLIEKSNWTYGNTIGFILEGQDNVGDLEARAWDFVGPGNGEEWNDYGNYAPRLVIVATTSDPTDYLTHREQLINYTAKRDWVTGRGGATPLIGSYGATAKYMVGGFNILMIDRSFAESHSSDAASEQTVSLPTPVNQTASCASNHLILLTDGDPWSDSTTPANDVSGSTTANLWDAGDALADFLSDSSKGYTVKTHAIAFGQGVGQAANLEDLAVNHGDGQYVQADNVGDVVDLFVNIANEVNITAATTTTPAASINAFNQLTHLNQLYFSVFKPSPTPRWPGNIKKYKVINRILTDKDGDPAVDGSGFFAVGGSDYWSTTNNDGADVTKGGAANLLPAPAARTVLTCLTDSCKSSTPLTIDGSLTPTQETTLGTLLGATSAAERDSMLNWLRGFDVQDEDKDGDTTDTRHFMGDPLHSRPVVVTYGTSAASPDLVIYVASNEGFIHAFDDDGQELWAFMPPELLGNVKTLYDGGVSAGTHPYGMDGPLITYEASVLGVMKKFLLVGMRRGGHSYYVFDITSRTSPELKFIVSNSATTGGLTTDTQLSNLGQTWSSPVPTKINVAGTLTDVLIFAGGYDTSQDQKPSNRSADSSGNDLFIINATTGALIWQTSTATAGYIEDTLDYSMPATPRVLDVNNDKLADQIYIGDMGGQIWRFDIIQGASSANLVRGGIIAQLASGSGTSGTANHRRFYESPDLVFINSNTLSINIGSGWRFSPLDTSIEDHFYHIELPKNLGPFDATDGYYKPIQQSDLFDTTNNLIEVGTAAEQATAETALAAANGWHINMGNTGEKILAGAVTVNNKILFPTYTPNPGNTLCTVNSGSNRLYVINANNAAPTGPRVTRYIHLNTSSIAPKILVYVPPKDAGDISTGLDVDGFIGTEKGGGLGLGLDLEPTYWYEKRD